MQSITRLAALAVAALAVPVSAQQLVRSVAGPATNSQYGKACIVVSDQNGDGYKDLLVGAPGFNLQRGAVYCLSGAYLAFGTGTQTLWSVIPTVNAGDLFGFAIADVGDANGDGVRDFLVGQPGYDNAAASNVGAVRLINGSSHAVISLLYGARTSTDPGIGGLFGSTIAACGDSTGDGKSEVMVGAPGSALSYARMLKGADLTGSGSNVVADVGTVHYSHAPATQAFQGGFKCAADPVRRTGALNSGGSSSGADCTGNYSLDFNARIASGIDPSLVAGAEIYAQYWSRDPLSASHTSLSNALRFVINP